MHLERRTVSRKTPRDGKLEISPNAAQRLAPLGSELRAEWQGEEGPAAIVRMQCTCGSGGGQHEHHFLESALFRTLPVGEDIDLSIEAGIVRARVTPPG